MHPPDPAFAEPRLAALYDALDGDRTDLATYLAIVEELDPHTVVDLGCGTGSLTVLLARVGRTVIGVDPAAASLDVARGKPDAERVIWVEGDATALADLGGTADLVVMTGNVAQVFVTDDDWNETLLGVGDGLRPGGWFVFETRRPEVRDWERWELAPTAVTVPDGRQVVVSRTVTEVALPLVRFESRTVVDGEMLISHSTLRFRERLEIERDLERHGLEVSEVRDAPDRPGKELVFLARRG